METLSSKSETSHYISTIQDRRELINEAHLEPIERRDGDQRISHDMPDGSIEERSTLKTLLQAPKTRAAMSYDSPPKTSMKLTTRWRAESERSGNNEQNIVNQSYDAVNQRSPKYTSSDNVSPVQYESVNQRSPKFTSSDNVSPVQYEAVNQRSPKFTSSDNVRPVQYEAVNQRSPNFSPGDNVSPVQPPVQIEQNHTERITHHNEGETNIKKEGGKKETHPRGNQMTPLDLSCKDPIKQIQNGELYGDGGRRLHRMFSSPADLMSSPVNKPESKSKGGGGQATKESAPFDPLFILSQVACEKLTELEQTEPEKKGKGNKSKKSKKGSKKSKKKSKDKVSREPNQNVGKVENGMVVNESYVQGNSNSQSGNSLYNVNEKEIRMQNGNLISQLQSSPIDISSSSSAQVHSGNEKTAPTGTPSADSLESRQKHQGSVNEKTQAEGMAERKYWPFTCRVCSTRFKNAAFLKIHEKLAHENKVVRSERTSDELKFVPKDVTSEQVKPKENGIPNPFPIHWKNSSDSRADAQEQSYAIPCILKVQRQPSVSDMNSPSIKTDSVGIEDAMKGFKCKLEADLGGKRAAEIFSGGVTEFGSQHPRPKLEVDGSSYEIIKVERERSAPNNDDNSSAQPVAKGIQHKLYLQICDRNQSGGIDSTVKIERDTTVYPTEGSDESDRGDPTRLNSDGNPNQIRVPTSLALKFIPGGDGDSQTGYQHKVYLKIADGNESSIQIKTGTLRTQSPSRVGGTAVKIESTFEHTPRQFHVHDTTRPHKCHYCPKHFPSISALTAHERIHTGEKPYECRFCGRAFYHQNDRRKHERIHTGEKPYECSICGQKFTNKGQVKIHERNHTGERPYQCRHCHKCFKSISNVNRHEKIHTGLKPYTCPVCSRGFSRREHVRTHEEICRKKMLEDDEELADNPIGDVKLPYFRKIDKPDGVDDGMDEPPVKRGKLDEEERRFEDKHWVVKHLPREFRRSYSEPFDMYESRTSPESSSRDEKQQPNDLSPLLYNSGPPVRPETLGASSRDGLPTAVDYVEDVTGRINRDHERLKQAEHSRTHDQNVTNESTRNYYSSHLDSINRRFSPVPRQHVIQETNPAVNSPPVICLSSDKSPREIVNKNPNDEAPAPVQQVVAPNNVNKPGVVVERIHSNSDKLSAHIESLHPMVNNPDKKEPRHYVCGPIAQPEITKLSESIPERHRLTNPMGNSTNEVLSISDLYSRQPPVSIHMKSAHTAMHGRESPPVLTAASIGNQRTVEKRYHENGPPNLTSLDSGFEEPPALNSSHSIRGFLPANSRSPENTVPPLLERNMSVYKPVNNMREVPASVADLHTLQRADLALETLRNVHRAAEYRAAAHQQNSMSN